MKAPKFRVFVLVDELGSLTYEYQEIMETFMFDSFDAAWKFVNSDAFVNKFSKFSRAKRKQYSQPVYVGCIDAPRNSGRVLASFKEGFWSLGDSL